MTEAYRFDYGPDTVYANVMELVASHSAPDRGVVVDVGCGYGAVAEKVRELGLTYLGVDADRTALDDLAARGGFEVALVDLADVESAVAEIGRLLGTRPLAGILALDIIEHLTMGDELLSSLRQLSDDRGGAPLFVSIPNVTHFDLVAKLLLGRWDVTRTGLLDRTHVSLYSPARLADTTARAGWREIASNDFELPESDQHFPEQSPVLAAGTPLHDLLLHQRQQAAEGALVNQFVRAYVPAPPARSPEEAGEGAPFLSILVRTVGRRRTFEETLLSLAAQTSRNYEVLVLLHNVSEPDAAEVRASIERFDDDFVSRVRIVPVEGGLRGRPLNFGVRCAKGEYIAVLDDDDLAFAHWVETFEAAARRQPGAIARSYVSGQEFESAPAGSVADYYVTRRPLPTFFEPFDILAHFTENYTPICAVAIPRGAYVDLGLAYDETLYVLEDWDLFVRAALVCGVVDSGQPTSLYRIFNSERSRQLHDEEEWQRVRDKVSEKFSRTPLLLPPGSRNRIADLVRRADLMERELEVLRRSKKAQVLLQLYELKKAAKRVARRRMRM